MLNFLIYRYERKTQQLNLLYKTLKRENIKTLNVTLEVLQTMQYSDSECIIKCD
jgi:hypothetical protein